MYYDFVFYMPNSFTPNGDKRNDTFGPKGLRMDKYISYEFVVYNQWGGIIYSSEDINEKWNGENAPDGVYSWLIIIKDELGKVRKESGNITLIR